MSKGPICGGATGAATNDKRKQIIPANSSTSANVLVDAAWLHFLPMILFTSRMIVLKFAAGLCEEALPACDFIWLSFVAHGGCGSTFGDPAQATSSSWMA